VAGVVTVLVTGAGGSVGSALVAELLGAGESVIAAVRPGGRPPPPATERLRVVSIDLPDLAALADLPAPRAIFHAAAVVDPAQAASPVVCQQVNAEGTRRLAEWALQRGSRFILLSSIAAMGFYDAPGGVDEGAACRPTTPYGRSKLAAEEAVLELVGRGLDAAIVRPPTLYGPRDHYNFLALTRAIARRVFVLIGGGGNRMPIMSVDNLVAALRAVDASGAQGVFLAADRDHTTLRDIAAAIARGLGRSGAIPSAPRWLAHAGAAVLEPLCGLVGVAPPLSHARVRTLTVDFGFRLDRLRMVGYRPPLSMEAGIATTVAAYAAQGLL
jgi:nucleoside-diphosphate-sugar epimerase